MSARKGGPRAGTRRLFRKTPRSRGKISLTRYFMPFAVGDRAVLVAEPAVQNALYHQRFHGKSGFVVGKQGECYKLEIKDGGKSKLIIVHPIHLKKLAATVTKKAVVKRAVPKGVSTLKSAAQKAAKPKVASEKVAVVA